VLGRRLGSARQGRASLVVGPIGLPGVGEERDDGGNSLRRSRLAGRDHNAEVDEVVVDAAGAGLDDVDILAADGVLDLAAALAAREFCEDAVAGRDAEEVADIFRQLRVRVAAEEDDVADHGGR